MGFPSIGSFGIGKSRSSSKSFVNPAQVPFLNFGYNQGRNIYSQYGQGAGGFAQQAGGDLFGAGMGILPQMTSNPFLSGLASQAGGNPELVNQQVGQLGSDIGRFFNQSVLPGIGHDFQGIGAFGGSRQGVAQGIAGQGAMDAFSRGVTDIYAADQQRGLQAGIGGGGLLAQGGLGALSMLGDLFGVGMGQFTGGFAPLLSYMQAIGDPTVLSKGKSSAWNMGVGEST